MVKKVTLDTLDIEEAAHVLKEASPVVEEAVVKPAAKWFASRWLLLSSGIIITLIVVGGLSSWSRGTKKAHRAGEVNKSAPVAPVAINDRMTVLNDFIIPGMDDKGSERAVLCDLTIELSDNRYQGLIKKNLVEVRNVVYNVAKRKKTVLLRQREGRNMVKDEIGIELAGLLGEDVIRRIYFTKFVVL